MIASPPTHVHPLSRSMRQPPGGGGSGSRRRCTSLAGRRTGRGLFHGDRPWFYSDPPSPPYLAGGSTAVESSNPHTPPNFLRIAAWSKIFRVLLLYGHSPSTTVNLKRSLSHATIYLTGGGVYRYSRELGRLRVSTTRHGMETTETPCRPDDRCRWAPRHYAVSGEDDRSRRYLLIEGLCSITVLTDSKPA